MAGGSSAKKRGEGGAPVISMHGAGHDAGTGSGKKRGGRKEKKQTSIWLIGGLAVTILLIVGFITAVFYFDIFDARTSLFGFLHNLDPEYQSLEARKEELIDLEKQLRSIQQKLDQQQLKLDERALGLDEAEAELEAKASSRTPVYRPPVNEDDVKFMTDIGKIYSSMSSENAAEVMVRLHSVEDMAAIIYYMPQSSAAAVLEQMEPDIAAQITDKLLYS